MSKEIIGLEALDKVSGEWKEISPKTVMDAISAGELTLEEYIETRIEYVKGIIEDVVGNAPEALDTLEEISEALKNDPNSIGEYVIFNVLEDFFEPKYNGMRLSEMNFNSNWTPLAIYMTPFLSSMSTNAIEDIGFRIYY